MAPLQPIEPDRVLKECRRFMFKNGVELKGLMKFKNFKGIFEEPLVGAEKSAKACFVDGKEL